VSIKLTDKKMISYENLIKRVFRFLSEIQSKNGFKDILKNSQWLFLDKAIRAILGFVVLAWMARYLGPSQFGELSFYLALIVIFGAITTLGMDGIVVREIAKAPVNEGVILGTVFWMRLLAGFIVWICILIGIVIIGPEDQQELWILGILGVSLVFQSGDVVDLWFQGKSQNKKGVYARLSAYLFANALKILLIILKAKLVAFVIVVVLENVLVALAMYISYRNYPSKGKWLKSWALARQLFSESWPYLISGISIMTYMRIDQVMIKEMLGKYELGLFSAVTPFAAVWNVIPVIICAVLFPYMSRKKMESAEEFRRYLVYLFRLFWVISIALVILTNLVSHFLVRKLYGDAYLESASILNIYIFTIIPIFLGVAQNIWIVNEGRSNLLFLQTITGAISSIVLNFSLIYLLGLEGAAIAAVFSQFISALLINLIFEKRLFRMQLGLMN
jgi:PST family polysaccharide transporter